jgi:capsular exopolysaccharide synthesis family protein
MNNTIRTGEDVLNYAGIPALASIPIKDDEFQRKALRKKATPLLTGARVAAPIVTIAQPKSQVAEAYRALRTSVLLSSSGAPPKVILVTSALPEEGKTTTSVNTAVVLAQKNSRVLLVDADLRRPRVHHYFQIPQSPGLTTLLTGGAPEDAPPVPSSIPNLFTLPSGMCPPYPAELLSSPAMKAALARWREEFDHIVIDSPPSLSVTDAVLLSEQVDGLLLVARASQTSRAALRRATMLLRTVNARILGVVLNGVDLSSPDGYYYHYGYYYGKSHSYYEEERAAE